MYTILSPLQRTAREVIVLYLERPFSLVGLIEAL